MTPEEQRIAIADFRGWKLSSRKTSPHASAMFKHQQWFSPGGQRRKEPPDYPNDLNAIRDAVMELRRRDRLKYAMMHKELERIVAVGNSIYDDHSWATADATAGQRTEAFLKAIGRWKPTSLPQDTSRSFRAGSYGETP